MGLPNVMNTGRTGMVAARAAIATTGHNITNANTEGFSRQRVELSTTVPEKGIAKGMVGRGVQIDRVGRVNDEYLEKQLRNGGREMAHMEEKDFVLRQVEDVFNEMGGDGLNRLMSRFFNEFRNLANDPNSEAVRQAVREATQALVNDFRRVHKQIDEIRSHIDSRLSGYATEINATLQEVKELNHKIKAIEVDGTSPNDLLDMRDRALKKLASFMDITTHKDEHGSVNVDLKGVGPLVVGSQAEQFYVERSKANEHGKPENSVDLKTTASANSNITQSIRAGKLGALLQVRDQALSVVQDRLDELAFNITNAVNQIHSQGYTRSGAQGVDFFKPLASKERASQFIGLSDAVSRNAGNIASAALPDAPSDNRIAIALSGLQNAKLMGNGTVSVDDWYNSIVSDVGVLTAKNRATMNQQQTIVTQLNKLRDQLSGVSIDEETANLLQFQHTFDASAKVIQVADEMLETILNLKR